MLRLCVFLLILIFPHALWAETLLAFTRLVPYHYNENNAPRGITVALVEEAFRRMDEPVKLIELPWSRALRYLENGEVDGVFELLKTPVRETYADYSSLVLMMENVSLFVPESSSIQFDGDLQQLAQFRFGGLQDFSYGEKFDAFRSTELNTEFVTAVSLNDLFLRLINDNLDIIVGDQRGVLLEYRRLQGLKVHSLPQIKRLQPNVEETPSYIAFSKKSQRANLRKRFDQALANMIAEGVYSKIVENWADY
ncbi:transporter substrate-binding domain-containing protein [Hahella aquimaris]|uniref:substrate-binding periplasmic protein n=1 Tax=Hahella sp. HNIBRBA332 TaxID=3015983 RepID=UPI00273C0818|nr:transporter substrate-binding domain-containing protein [Hahella sp. HNIBRBA332]WLQ14438.1 transporter substrate-binding domain-containing protein [Hahella sp. HNIBRBA332]